MTTVGEKPATVVVEVRDGHDVALNVSERVILTRRLFGAGHRLELPRAQAQELIAAGDVVELDPESTEAWRLSARRLPAEPDPGEAALAEAEAWMEKAESKHSGLSSQRVAEAEPVPEEAPATKPPTRRKRAANE